MALKIEQECDWCGGREAVDYPRNGGPVPLPAAWEAKPPFPGSSVGPQEKQEVCAGCAAKYDGVLVAADRARDAVFSEALMRARQETAPKGPIRGGQTSSFNR